MTKIEKQIVVVIIAFCGLVGAGVGYTKYTIKESGGIKQIIIDVGKEIKDISNEIDRGT